MDYTDALHRLLQLVDHERMVSVTRERVRYDLRRMEALLHRLSDPHVRIPTIHIAGTKGKGSTAAMCASVLSRQGYRTGLYTSPHLHSFRERISVDGAPVGEEEFADLVERIWPALMGVSENEGSGEVTLFEALTAMAFCHFRDKSNFQVLEVGLGGRLDTTNLASPQVCAITSLSLDHTSILGETIECIAAEKAGIIKAGVTVVSSPQVPEAMQVIESVCSQRSADLINVGEDLTWRKGTNGLDGQGVEVCGRRGTYSLWIPLLGDFQLENVTTAMGVLEVLQERGFEISRQAIEEGLRQVRWPCRMEVLNRAPLVICDGAHNPYSAARLMESLPAYFRYRRVVPVVGVSQDKNLDGIVKELADSICVEEQAGPRADGHPKRAVTNKREDEPLVFATRSRHPRAASTKTVANAFLARGVNVVSVEGVAEAVTLAMQEAGNDDLILATGSLFVAAEAREALKGIEPELYPKLQTAP